MLDKFKRLYRGIIVVICFMIFGLGALIIRYFVFPIQGSCLKDTTKKKYKYSETLHKSWYFFVKLLETLRVIKVQVDDIDKIKNIKNSIIVSTHPSYIDILILMSIIPNSTCFVAHKLTNNPFFRGMVELLFIPEGISIDELVAKTSKVLGEGFNVIIFPMGTRHKKDEYPKIRRGTALIAQKTNKNIVALKIATSRNFLQINQPIYDAGTETIIYNISYLEEINITKFISNYPDEVDFRTNLTKRIGNSLYKDNLQN